MKKILIVAKDEGIREALKLACKGMKFESIAVDHSNALGIFLEEEPAAVIICDYNERGEKEYFEGTETFGDIKNSATNEIVLRMGFPKADYEDYLQMPFKLETLKKKLIKKGGK